MQTTEKEETLYLIDGYAAIFRAFYAIRNPLYSRVTGEPTNATLVFAQMLLKLYTTLKPDYVIVAWDAPGKTFRDALYAQYPHLTPEGALQPEPTDTAPPKDAVGTGEEVAVVEVPPDSLYKGTRIETPDALHEQVPRIRQLLELFGIPVIGLSGLEADDIIATLTTRVLGSPEHSHLRVRIATRDKDMEQLLGPRVTLFDIHTGAELDEAGLWHKKGITPAQVVDYLSLIGDTVDNIPGVAGIGPKTASKLLQQFGSLHELWEAADMQGKAPGTVPGKAWSNLEQARPWLPLSHRLVTLKADAEIPFDLEQARARAIPAEDLLNFCDELGFVSFKKQCLELVGTSS